MKETKNTGTGQILNRYELGFHDDWPGVVDALVDLQNAQNLDETTLRILSMALDGHSFREIGKELGMSHNTAIKKLREMIKG